MKKYIATGLVIVTFGIYLLFNRQQSTSIASVSTTASTTDASGGGTSALSRPGTAAGNGPRPATVGNDDRDGGASDDSSDDGSNIGIAAGGTTTTTKPVTSVPQKTTPPPSSPAPVATPASGAYKDGSYSGSVADAFYGKLQVAAVVSGGKLTDVQFLQYPSDNGHSAQVSNTSLPILKQEAIQSQSANVNIVSGATDTSQAFQQSLAVALAAAKN
jgi:uncharacterized protein with FMN-binding domain